MYFIINLNKNYRLIDSNLVFNSVRMSSALKLVYFFIHFFLIQGLLILIFQGATIVQKKLYLSLLIFILLNLIRLLLKENGKNRND